MLWLGPSGHLASVDDPPPPTPPHTHTHNLWNSSKPAAAAPRLPRSPIRPHPLLWLRFEGWPEPLSALAFPFPLLSFLFREALPLPSPCLPRNGLPLLPPIQITGDGLTPGIMS